MNRYTIGYIDYKSEIFERQLGPSIQNLVGGFDVLNTSCEKAPAFNYNDMIDQCETPYLILTHQDVSFSPDLLSCIDKTIEHVPDFGALGMVGARTGAPGLRWSDVGGIKELDTADCCFIIVRKDLGIKFNSTVFDDFHMYVEDYCAQVSRVLGKKCYTILIKSEQLDAYMHYSDLVNKFGKEFLIHHGYTNRVAGVMWGKYREYQRKFWSMWPGLQTT